MLPARIEHATRTIGKPPNWDDHSSEHCSALSVRDVMSVEGLPWMVSAWQPTPAELALLINGESVHLWIQGQSHPVVAIAVGELK